MNWPVPVAQRARTTGGAVKTTTPPGATLTMITLLLQLNCGNGATGTGTSHSEASAVASQKGMCPRAEALRARLDRIDVDRVYLALPAPLPLSASGDRHVPDAPLVQVTEHGVLVNQLPAGGPSEVVEAVRQAWALRGKGDVILAVPAAARVDHAVLDALVELGEVNVWVLANEANREAPPVPDALAEIARNPDAGERARDSAVVLTEALKRCPSAKKLFAELTRPDVTDKGKIVRDRLPKAIDACDCDVSDDVAGIVAYVMAPGLPVLAKRVASSPTGKSMVASKMSGQELYDAIPMGDVSALRLE